VPSEILIAFEIFFVFLIDIFNFISDDDIY
jgi:hypothetical protein